MTYRPDLYDAVTPVSLQGDVEWYRQKAETCGGPVLELGAGMLDALAAKLAGATAAPAQSRHPGRR